MRILVFSYMYPSPRHPTSGVWVEQQARALSRAAEVEVVSPVPWAPRVLWPLAARWAAYGRQPRVERRHGLVVHHPRYPQPVGQWAIPVAGAAMARAAHPGVATLVRTRGMDVIHAHQLLPDGLAAVLLGRRLGLPVVCTLHGSDVTTVPFHDPVARAAARFVARRAGGFIAVVDALAGALARVAPDHAPVTVVPNGIDVEQFQPLERGECRRRLGLEPEARIVLYAGLLIARKGVDVLLDAFAGLGDDARLVLVGGSAERDDRRAALEARAAALGCAGRVRFVGPRPHEEMPAWFSAADLFVLASRLEGFPTVVREAIACGTPCVVTALPGVAAEIGPACGTECGLVVPPDDVDRLGDALRVALARPWDRAALRRRAMAWRWERNVAATLPVLEAAAGAVRRVA